MRYPARHDQRHEPVFLVLLFSKAPGSGRYPFDLNSSPSCSTSCQFSGGFFVARRLRLLKETSRDHFDRRHPYSRDQGADYAEARDKRIPAGAGLLGNGRQFPNCTERYPASCRRPPGRRRRSVLDTRPAGGNGICGAAACGEESSVGRTRDRDAGLLRQTAHHHRLERD